MVRSPGSCGMLGGSIYLKCQLALELFTAVFGVAVNHAPSGDEELLAQVVAGGCVVLPMEHLPVSVIWPRVRSDECVLYTAAQFPVADVNDEEGLLKLAAASCSRCFNPYHIALDCPNYFEDEVPDYSEDEVDEENPQAC